jgi:hypothetical protein
VPDETFEAHVARWVINDYAALKKRGAEQVDSGPLAEVAREILWSWYSGTITRNVARKSLELLLTEFAPMLTDPNTERNLHDLSQR